MENWTRHDTRALIEAAGDTPLDLRGAVKVIRRHHGEEGLVEHICRLETFCMRTNSVPLIWGKTDCSLVLADWAMANGYPDAAESWRGAYTDEAGCRALISARGDLKDVVAACALAIGLKPIVEPEFGAVAVIGSPRNPERQWGAIWNGARWLVKWGDERSARWTPLLATALGMWRI